MVVVVMIWYDLMSILLKTDSDYWLWTSFILLWLNSVGETTAINERVMNNLVDKGCAVIWKIWHNARLSGSVDEILIIGFSCGEFDSAPFRSRNDLRARTREPSGSYWGGAFGAFDNLTTSDNICWTSTGWRGLHYSATWRKTPVNFCFIWPEKEHAQSFVPLVEVAWPDRNAIKTVG